MQALISEIQNDNSLSVPLKPGRKFLGQFHWVSLTTTAMIRNGHTMKCALFLSLCHPYAHYFMFIYTMVSLSLPHYLLLPSVMNFSLVNFRFSKTTNFINAKHQFPITQFSPLFSRSLIAYSAFCRGNILSVQTSPGLTLSAVLP